MTRPHFSIHMGLLDFILNLIGLLLWFNWRAAWFDPLSKSTPATLAGTLRRAEKSHLKRWHLPLGLVGLLFLRAPLYGEFGGALNWTGKLDVLIISIPFNSNANSYLPMLLYSFYSFVHALIVFLMWALFLAILKNNAPENDSLRQVLRLHLGRVEKWPFTVKLLVPVVCLTPLWYGATWPLTYWGILPTPATAGQRMEQALVVGAGSYLAWKILIVGVLGLQMVSSYVYFGKNPFWQHLDIVARLMLRPLRALPLRFGKLDFAPVVGIALTLLIASVVEQGIKFPTGNDVKGQPRPHWINVPGLVDWYRRVST